MRWISTIFLTITAVLLIQILASILFEWNIYITSYRAMVFKGYPYYRSYSVVYSNGYTLEHGRWVNQLRLPTFRHFDQRKFVESVTSTTIHGDKDTNNS